MAALTRLAAESGGGNFLVTPQLGLMIWTLIAFGATYFILSRLAFPRIRIAALAISVGAATASSTNCPAPVAGGFTACYYDNINLSGNPVQALSSPNHSCVTVLASVVLRHQCAGSYGSSGV